MFGGQAELFCNSNVLNEIMMDTSELGTAGEGMGRKGSIYLIYVH